MPTPTHKLPTEGARVVFIGKGGSTKTHTLAHVLGHWSRMGIPVAAVDSDEPGEDEDGSLVTWNQMTNGRMVPTKHADDESPLTVKAQYSALRLPGTIIEETPAEGILGIDTGSWANRPGGAHHSALAMASLAVLCLQPHEGELHRSASVWAALKHLEDTGSRRPELVVLFTRVHHNAKSSGEVRGTMERSGITVLDNAVPNQMGEDGYSRAFGKPLELVEDDPMHKIAVEILGRVSL
ncbi:hypothetical protein OVA19_00230 [Streptomyces sp. SL203]|nr:hypothetical protein [Streptomyces sp. SL203]MCY1649249.1 hypothetical protein [Streptomyces sp. SL203]